MYRFFDKHGKKTLAVFGALLMLAFLLPSGIHCGSGQSQYGKIKDKSIDAYQIQTARSHLLALRQLVVNNPRTGRPVSAWDRIFSFENDPLLGTEIGGSLAPQIYQRVSDNDLTWLLLSNEAADSFTIADETEVDSYFNDNAKPQVITQERPSFILQPLTNPPAIEGMKQSVRIGLAIRDRFLRSMQNAKISNPMVKQAISERRQEIKSRLAIFSASDHEKQLAEPTDDELRVQFEAYASVVPGAYNAGNNPFGFGYRIPDKIRLQYLAVPDAEVAAAVIKSKDEFAWEEEARVYFARHWQEFVEKDSEEPQKNPATSPATTHATSQATTQATTAPVKPTFESVRQRVFDTVQGPLIEQKRRAVVNMIVQQLSDDYAKASNNSTATTQAVSSTTVRDTPLGSYEYLLKIRDEVQRRHAVTVDVVNDAELMDEFTLRGRQGLGMARVEEVGPRNRQQSVAQYLFSSVKALNPPSDASIVPIDIYQPTKPLWTMDRTYIARVVEAVASHPPLTMGDVKEKLEKDVRRKQAFAKAVEAANAAVAKAKTSGLVSLDQVVYTTKWMSRYAIRIEGAPVTDPYSDLLIEPMFEQLRGVENESQLPKWAVIKAERADQVVAVELFAVETRVNTRLQPFVQWQFRTELGFQEWAYSGIVEQWFTTDAVGKRVGYTRPDENRPQSDSPAPAPARPFIPG